MGSPYDENPGHIEVIPQLPMQNLEETKSFYNKKLGFNVDVFEAENFLICRRQHMELHFWLCEDRTIAENSSAYFRGGDIDLLYEEFNGAEIASLSTKELRPWGMVEFYVHDPNVNLLKFGRIPLPNEN